MLVPLLHESCFRFLVLGSVQVEESKTLTRDGVERPDQGTPDVSRVEDGLPITFSAYFLSFQCQFQQSGLLSCLSADCQPRVEVPS